MEYIEWSRVWRENATDEETPRILFIGDSIVEGAKTKTVEKLKGVCNPSFYTTSKDISDPFMFDEISLVAKQDGKRYKLIYFNNGLHTGGLSVEDYKAYYKNTALKLLEFTDTLCLGLSTPVTNSLADAGKWETPVDNKLDYSSINDLVLEFNKAVREVGNELSLPVLDLYSVVDGNFDIRTPDGYHYKAEGNDIISDSISDFVKTNIK